MLHEGEHAEIARRRATRRLFVVEAVELAQRETRVPGLKEPAQPLELVGNGFDVAGTGSALGYVELAGERALEPEVLDASA